MIPDLQIEKGLTMLFVTHDIGLARKIADRIGVMLAGRLMESGPAVQILNQPTHPYTRWLMNGGAPQMDVPPLSLTPPLHKAASLPSGATGPASAAGITFRN